MHFDLSAGAFGKIAKTGHGLPQYRPVTCPVQGQLQVKKVEVRSGGTAGSWLAATRQDYTSSSRWACACGRARPRTTGTSMSAGATFSLSANFA